MHNPGGKRRQTYRDILGTAGIRRAIAHPLAWPSNDCLPRTNLEVAVFILHTQSPPQHERDFFELGTLTGLHPPAGRNHPSQADRIVTRIHPPGVFLYSLRFVACRLNNGGSINEPWHESSVRKSLTGAA